MALSLRIQKCSNWNDCFCSENISQCAIWKKGSFGGGNINAGKELCFMGINSITAIFKI